MHGRLEIEWMVRQVERELNQRDAATRLKAREARRVTSGAHAVQPGRPGKTSRLWWRRPGTEPAGKKEKPPKIA